MGYKFIFCIRRECPDLILFKGIYVGTGKGKPPMPRVPVRRVARSQTRAYA